MDIYREEILEHWQNPQNFGEMQGADFVIDQINPLCGDEITFYFKITNGPSINLRASPSINLRASPSINLRASKLQSTNEKRQKAKDKRRIADVSFTGRGCAISMASASILSGVIKGKSVSQLSKITGSDVLELIGGRVGPARLKCAFLPLEVIKKLNGKEVEDYS